MYEFIFGEKLRKSEVCHQAVLCEQPVSANCLTIVSELKTKLFSLYLKKQVGLQMQLFVSF